MITAVDTNVLLDVFIADREFGPRAREALRASSQEGQLVACEAVWAELGAAFPSEAATRAALARLGVEFSPLTEQAALDAGGAWHAYRSRGGRRSRVVADFLIGAHALRQADRLLTRDRGFYRSYFRRLRILDPAAR